MKNKIFPTSKTELRRQAEMKLDKQKVKSPSAKKEKTDSLRLIHELDVYRVEFEMQFEELKNSYAEMEAALHVYNSAPSGYFVLGPDGAIQQVNQAGGNLLDMEQGKLIKRRFALFVTEESRPVFNAFLERTLTSEEKQTCEVALLKNKNEQVWVQIEASSAKFGNKKNSQCYAVVIDITERKQAEGAIRSLARFPAENPNPVLRIALNGNLIYANEAAFVLMMEWKLEVGKAVPEALKRFTDEVFETHVPKTVEMACGERIFSIAIEPTPMEKDVNLYGRDITIRKQAEEKVLYQALLLNAVNDAVVASDSQYGITFWNDAAESLYGWKAEEVLGRIGTEILITEWPEVDAENMRREIAMVGRWRGEATQLHKDGRRIPVEISSLVLRDAKGQITGYISVNRDITERKRSVDALLESESRFRSLFENMLNGFAYCQMIFDRERPKDLIYLDVNSAFETQTGLKDVIGKKISEVIPGIRESDPELIETYGRVSLTGIPETFETYVESMKTWFFVSVYCPKKGYFVAIFDVITERKQMEKILRVNEEKFRRLVQDMQVGVLLQGPQAEILLSNASALELLGLSEDQLLGKTSFDSDWNVIHEDGSPFPGETHPVPQAIAARRPVLGVVMGVYRPTTKSRVWLLVDAVPQLKDDGTILQVVCTFIDITTRKRAEEEIKQLNATLEQRVQERTRELQGAQEKLIRQEKLAILGQLAGSVAHELRNPIGVIKSAVYYLEMVQPDANEKIKQYHTLIEEEVRISDKIITDLLDFARVKSVDRKVVSVSNLIHQTLERFPAPANVEVTLDIPADLPQIFVDLRQMTQVLGNLTVNACQAMQDGGKLTINSEQLTVDGEPSIIIAVKDTGVGITSENMKKLFEPLFTTKTKGIGLGLAVCKKLTEANDGKIEVESEAGVGSTFTIYLPVSK